MSDTEYEAAPPMGPHGQENGIAVRRGVEPVVEPVVTVTYRYRQAGDDWICLCDCHTTLSVHLVGLSTCCGRACFA